MTIPTAPAATHVLDLLGESCPFPVMHSLETLAQLAPGDVLQIVVDCPQAYRNVPEEVTRLGHRQVAEPVRDGAEMTFTFEVRDPAST